MASKQHTYQDRILVDPNILAGKPVIKGTRIPVELVLERLGHDLDLKTLFADYPRLTEEDVKACLVYAKRHIPTVNKPSTTALLPQAKNQQAIEKVLALAGAWKDLPSEHIEEDLDRIRHSSKPTPPLAL